MISDKKVHAATIRVVEAGEALAERLSRDSGLTKTEAHMAAIIAAVDLARRAQIPAEEIEAFLRAALRARPA